MSERAFVVPTIDVSGWGSDTRSRRRIAAAVGDACRSVGFMQIVGHGVPDPVVDGLRDAIDVFFALSMSDKERYCAPRPSINRGYTPPRSERLSYSLGLVTPDDLFEAFNVGTSAADFPSLDLDMDIYAENIWPAEASGFRV